MQTFSEDQIKKRIRDLTENYSQYRIADYFGISESYISRYLKGDRPLPEKILQKLSGKRIRMYEIDENQLNNIKP